MIYFVQNRVSSSVNFWRTDDGRFQMIQAGKMTLLMTGSDYTIVHYSFAKVFEDLLSDEIEIQPIQIIRPSTGEVWNEYSELQIKEYIDPEKISMLSGHEHDVWQYRHSLFVSKRIKEKIELLFTNKFDFFEGFSAHGG